MTSLANKVSLITGAGSGIGAATAILFATRGSSVALNDLNPQSLSETGQACIAAGLKANQVLLLPGDVTQNAVPEDIVQQTVSHFGKLDILVNCAGIYREAELVSDKALETFDAIMNLNLRAMYTVTKAAAPHLKLTKGNVVNVSSSISHRSRDTGSAYTISKAAADGLTRTLAGELAPEIRVNSVNPGTVDTKIVHNSSMGKVSREQGSQFLRVWAPYHALKRIANPIEIAKPIAFLASDEASFVTGNNMLVDGGICVLMGPPITTE